MAPANALGLFVCGDVMTGRGIDQILRHPGNPVLYEPFVRDAREYVDLAELASGPIPRPVDDAYIWGDALAELERSGVDVRIVNLETSITTSEAAWPDKGINYRMHPQNVGCLKEARIDGCCLANNHVLDWAYAGLAETLQTLDAAGIARAGAGSDAAESGAPAVLEVAGKGRVLVFSFGSTTSGIPSDWAATEGRPGVNLLEDLSEGTARRAADGMRQLKRPGDVLLASIHWGPNWGYEVSDMEIRFARALVEGGVDLVHGHSSHHLKAIEVHREHLILYGCGDFVDDYEGVGGYEEFRPEWRLMYLIRIDPADGRLLEARLVPMTMRKLRLQRGSVAEAEGIRQLLNDLGAPFGTHVRRQPDNSLILGWH